MDFPSGHRRPTEGFQVGPGEERQSKGKTSESNPTTSICDQASGGQIRFSGLHWPGLDVGVR